MAIFKCICCGEQREGEKAFSCSKCGYNMYEMPFERQTILAREIVSFIKRIRLQKLTVGQLKFYSLVPRKDKNGEIKFDKVSKKKDDDRFPCFNEIQKYAVAADRTEKFIERLNASLEQIEKHYHTPFYNDYVVEPDSLCSIIEKYDATLKQALSALGLEIQIDKLRFPEIQMHYSELPKETAMLVFSELISNLHLLVSKVGKFIKLNNIYGRAYQYKLQNPYKPATEEVDVVQVLSKANADVLKTLQKQYAVDIFSDGTEELQEMLKVFWRAVSTIMAVPLLEKTEKYQLLNEEVFNAAIEEKLLSFLATRYQKIDETVFNERFWEGKTEDTLFALYNKMIELDSYGLMGVNKEKLLIPGVYEQQLNTLIGLSAIKDSILKIKSYALSNKGTDGLNIHMCFYGNPGTGKTEVARIISGILYENKILPTKKVIEVDRSDLVGQYVGETPQKTMSVIQRAMGGVLFIDEAYSLASKDAGFDYGHEAIATLIKAMEDERGKFCVILAGYRTQMHEMISTNPGFKSRIQFELDFPNYSRDELGQITQLMLKNRKYNMDDTALQKVLDITDVKRKESNFANAREIRNILDQVIMCQNVRSSDSEDRELGIVDVNRYIKDAKIALPTTGEGINHRVLTAEEELEQLVGLETTKRMIRKIKAYAKRNLMDLSFNLHMCFYGNPGTGKTEVARILSRILYDAGVLPEAKLVETDAHGLMGKYVGETAPKTKTKIDEAMGGVLFVDEAYSLVPENAADGRAMSYGEEAVSTLLKEMEDHRGQFCVIFAGYKKEMKNMLATNPGLESRIQFILEFPDYTREELRQIAFSFLNKKKYQIVDAAMDRILDVADYYRESPNFANARTVRNILDQVIMNQNLRAENNADDYNIILSDVEDYILDEGINLAQKKEERRIGFV